MKFFVISSQAVTFGATFRLPPRHGGAVKIFDGRPTCKQSRILEQFVRPFWIAIMYQKFQESLQAGHKSSAT